MCLHKDSFSIKKKKKNPVKSFQWENVDKLYQINERCKLIVHGLYLLSVFKIPLLTHYKKKCLRAIPLFESQMCFCIFTTSILLKDLIPQSQNDKTHSLESFIKIWSLSLNKESC